MFMRQGCVVQPPLQINFHAHISIPPFIKRGMLQFTLFMICRTAHFRTPLRISHDSEKLKAGHKAAEWMGEKMGERNPDFA